MERFFRSLKTDWMPEHGYASQWQAEADVLRYLTDYYNHQRPHSYNRAAELIVRATIVIEVNVRSECGKRHSAYEHGKAN